MVARPGEEECERPRSGGRALDPRRHSPTTGALQTHTAHEGDLTHAPKPTSRDPSVKARLGIAFAERTPALGEIALPERRERLDRRDDVVRAAHRSGEAGQVVARAVAEADHALEHGREARLVRAEADEDRPVRGHRPVRDVPPEDLAERLLVGPGHVRCRRHRVQLRRVGPAAPDDRLLALGRQPLPGVRVVLPALEEQDRRPGAGRSLGHDGDVQRLDQRRVLGPVDEPGRVEVVVVRPADGLVDQGGAAGEATDDRVRQVEHDVVARPRSAR